MVGRTADATLAIFPGDGSGIFGDPVIVGLGVAPSSIAVDDFDLDGYQDIVAGSYGAEVIFGAGSGTFQSPVAYDMGSALGIFTGDVDGNGTPDVTFSLTIATLLNGRLGAEVSDASGLVGTAAVLQARAGRLRFPGLPVAAQRRAARGRRQHLGRRRPQP